MKLDRQFKRPSPEIVARLQQLANRRLSAAEVEAGLRARNNEAEMDEARSLIRWFLRRYPMPSQRLAYARRAYARWSRAMPPGAARPGGR
jgi:hypothetical protein